MSVSLGFRNRNSESEEVRTTADREAIGYDLHQVGLVDAADHLHGAPADILTKTTAVGCPAAVVSFR